MSGAALRGRRQQTKQFPVAESVSIALKVQLDKFLCDENETELKFPSFLSAVERGFIHAAVAGLGLKSKSRGKGVNRYITVYKRLGSTIIQGDAKLILDSNMRCSITELLNNCPISGKEKDDLLSSPEKERSPAIVNRPISQLSNGVPQVPNTIYNPELAEFRSKLPVFDKRIEFLEALKHNQVLIVAGATGSGKTTQLPQVVLDHCQENKIPARVFCTQPRRISAVTVAERVASERSEKIGQSIGYQIRLESRVSPKTVLTYCTNGVLLRTLMGGETSLQGVTHIFVDEVHERDKFSDFLLIALRDNLPRFKELRVILMSATMDTQIFSRYFSNCPVISIPGRLFEVERLYLEDILKLTQHRTNRMKEAERELMSKAKSGQTSYWKHLEEQKRSAPEETVKEEAGAQESLDPALQADMDEFLDDCYKEGSLDSFCQVLYMYMSEGVPVDCAQSTAGRTGLMVAAHHGLTETVQQILQIGADPNITDQSGKTAYDYALEKGHKECANVLVTFTIRDEKANNGNTDENAADDFLLDVYNHSVSEEVIDHDLMLVLIKLIHNKKPPGSILVFMPGYDDIVTLRDMIVAATDMEDKYQIFILHSNMATGDQKKVFSTIPGTRKIIIATNIAETSITIDDVVYVVDSCRVKEKYYESSAGVCSLQCVWTSKACCHQRAGRAGRTRPGVAYHMCSKRRFNTFPQNSIPEILRVPLQELCLHTKLLASGNTPIADFLSKALEPPSFLAVRNAVTLLKTIGALTAMEDLTEIGQHLLDLTVEPKLGKMLLYACVMKCLDPILTIVCSLANKEPFILSMNAENRKKGTLARKDFAADSYSDHMALLRAFQAWQTARASGGERSFCSKNLICGATMEMIVGYRAQLLAQLRALSLVKARGSGDIKDVNLNSEKWHVVKAVLASGLYPAMARVDRQTNTLRTSKEVKVTFHPSSTLHCGRGISNTVKAVQSLPSDWITFEEISRIGRLCFIRCCTLVTPLTVALFGGPLRLPPGAITQRANPPGISSDSDSEEDDNNASPDTATLTLDEWTAFTADASDALSVYLLRQKLCALIIRRMQAPARPPSPSDEQVLNTVVHVLGAEERNVGLSQPVGIGQRPKPLTNDNGNWRSPEGEYRQYEKQQYYHQNNDYQNHYQNYGYRNNGYGRQMYGSGPTVNWRNDLPGQSYAPMPYNGPKSPMSPPNGKTLLANIEKYSSEQTESVRYFLVKVEDPHSLEMVLTSSVFIFTPNTAKKLLKAKQEGSRVIIFFAAAGGVSKFLGSATFTDVGSPIAPTAYVVECNCTQHVPFHITRHIVNALNENRRASATREGQELCSASGHALLSLLEQQNKRGQRGLARPIQKHN